MGNKWICFTSKDREELLNSDISFSLKKKIEKADSRIKVRSAKGKGMSFQRKVAQDISDSIEIPYLQGNDDSLIESRGGGQHGTDVILRGEAKKRFPFSVEVKAQESLNLVQAVNQAQDNKIEGTEWIVVHKKKALREPIVVLSWMLFLSIWKEIIKWRKDDSEN